MYPSFYIFFFLFSLKTWDKTGLTLQEPLVSTWPCVSQNLSGNHLGPHSRIVERHTEGFFFLKFIKSGLFSELDPTYTVS